MSAAANGTSNDQYTAAVDKQNFDGRYTAASVLVTLSVALAFYNSLEMVLLIASTFKRWKGLYFWSLTLCNLGVFLYNLGVMLVYFELGNLWLTMTIDDVGWIIMIICQSLVLYSRLGLILDSMRILKAVKWMIVFTSLILIPTVIVFDYGTSFTKFQNFPRGFFYLEHLQVVCFTIQELVLSGLYVWKTAMFLGFSTSRENTRSIVWQLLIINIVIIAMDIVIVTMQFLRLQLYQEALKGFFYSVKLKLELNILSKLVDLVHGESTITRSMTLATIDSKTIPGQAQTAVRDEMQVLGQDPMSSWSRKNSDEKGIMTDTESGLNDHHNDLKRKPSLFRGSHEGDEITNVLSHQSNYSARYHGRESDILYADFLRSTK